MEWLDIWEIFHFIISVNHSLTMNKTLIIAIISTLLLVPIAEAQVTQERQASLTPDKVLVSLMQGNKRFVAGNASAQDVINNSAARRAATARGQYPKAVILSCLDSRVPVETVFDMGIGDLFVGRVAGNIEDNDQIGSMEFATKLSGAKLVMVLGHTECGAVRGACDNARLGHLTGIMKKIRPAVDAAKKAAPVGADTSSSNPAFVNAVAVENVRRTLSSIRRHSPILADLEKSGQIRIVGGMYDIYSGKVSLLQ